MRNVPVSEAWNRMTVRQRRAALQIIGVRRKDVDVWARDPWSGIDDPMRGKLRARWMGNPAGRAKPPALYFGFIKKQGKFYGWHSGQAARLPKSRTKIVMYGMKGSPQGTLFETWLDEAGKRNWRAISELRMNPSARSRRNPAGSRKRAARPNKWKDLSAEEFALGQILRNHTIERYKRRSKRAFDLNIEGKWTYGKGKTSPFKAWLPLLAIREMVNWTRPEVARMSDHSVMVVDGDWSGIRDSSKAAIWAIFDRFVRTKIPRIR